MKGECKTKEQEMSHSLQDTVQEYIDLDNQIKAANKELNVLKKRHKELNEMIKDGMKQDKIPSFDLGRNEHLCYKEYKTATQINKKLIHDGSYEFFKELNIDNSSGLAQQMSEYIYENRPFTERTVLRRVKVKESGEIEEME